MRLINLQNHTGWPGNMQKSEKKNSNFFFQGHPGHHNIDLERRID